MLEILGLITGVGGITGFISYISKKYSYIDSQQAPAYSAFGVAKEWMKARKSKICPMVEWR